MHPHSSLPEYLAVRHLLDAPSLAQRTASYIGDADFDWPGLIGETSTMSGGESLLVLVAYELWHAEKSVGLWELARRLDPWSFERVLEALSICRTGKASAA